MTVAVDWVQERLDKSPVRELRKSQYPDRALLRKKLGISDSVIYFAELVCYPKLPLTLENHLIPVGERRDFHKKYHEFQVSERKLFGLLFNLSEVTTAALAEAGESPVYSLCAHLALSRADLGKGLCLQPSLLYRHDRGLAGSLSDQFRVALLQSGVSREVVNYLDKRQTSYAN